MAALARHLADADPEPCGRPARMEADRAPLDAASLFSAGGDGRIRLDAGSGCNRYGCAALPDPALLPFGSCTASTPSPAAQGAVERLTVRLRDAVAREPRAEVYRQELDRIRARLAGCLGLTDMAGLKTILSPSGTDLHRIALHLACVGAAAPPLVILPEPHETGSGVVAAMGGRVGSAAALRAAAKAGGPDAALLGPQIMTSPSRRPDGSLRPGHQVDEDVAIIAAAAARLGRRVLLVMMDVSKTGLISPSVACAEDLKRRFPDQVQVMVDACQLRLAPATVAAYLRQDFMVAVTGSKFMTGPAFSAALLVPPASAARLQGQALPGAVAEACLFGELPDGWVRTPALEARSNFGLVARWEAALEEMRRFAALPPTAVQAFFAGFAAAVSERLADDSAFEAVAVRPLERIGLGAAPDWDREQTIFPFLLRAGGRAMSPVETLGVQRLLAMDLGDWARWPVAGRRAQIGQPVTCGLRADEPLTALRLCASARLAADATAPGGRGGAAAIGDALTVLDKTAWLTRRMAAL